MNRKQAILEIVRNHENAIFIFSNGLTTRYAVDTLKLNGLYFFLLHGMGETLSVGSGLASTTTREVVVVDGDGNATMGLSSWLQLRLFDNLHYYILKNNVHATTGHQKVMDFSDVCFDKIHIIEIDEDQEIPPTPPKPDLIIKSFRDNLNGKSIC